MAPERPTYSSNDLSGGGLSGGGGLHGWWKWLVALASFGVFLAVLWYAYSSGTDSGGGPIRTVTANPEPYKVRPEDPDGEKIPDQDKLVYGEAVGRPQQEPETLARPAEQPVARPAPVPSEAKPEPAPAPKTVETPAPPKPAVQAEETPQAKPAQQPPAVLKPPAELKPPAAKPQAPQQPAQVASTGGYRVQIGSFQSREAADDAWNHFAPKHPAVLAGAQRFVKEADLGSKGVWYRLQFGPYATRDAADKVCSQLKAAGQDCLIEAP